MATASGFHRSSSAVNSRNTCSSRSAVESAFFSLIAPSALHTSLGSRLESQDSTTPKPVTSVPQSIPKTRIGSKCTAAAGTFPPIPYFRFPVSCFTISALCPSLNLASSPLGYGLHPQFFMCSRCHWIRSSAVAPPGIVCSLCHSRFIVPPSAAPPNSLPQSIKQKQQRPELCAQAAAGELLGLDWRPSRLKREPEPSAEIPSAGSYLGLGRKGLRPQSPHVKNNSKNHFA